MARPRIGLYVVGDPARDGILIAGHWLNATEARALADTIHDLLDRQEQHHDQPC
ncbi:hypothetical protein RD149_11955 [Gordonia westfalica]|uniref:Uncharacterized protein n=1 Tax=Gordonia westfalica TaxID=158898 RepID=A0ABU2GUP9_9ACTN|nr:hypothetical protein [Gordonia westfalica]MDS1114479.1 hypothetical protein [Gordonia westfalica]